jgi:aspartyl-tRNA(Asn)/glutamyl-tRNA(Gln) amidotransferase subunit C
MADTLTRTDVERIAALARLELTDDEVTLFAGQLSAILAYADQIRQVDTAGIDVAVAPPASPDTTTPAAGRDDVPVPSLDRDVVLSQAPAADRAAGLFKVPRVIGS